MPKFKSLGLVSPIIYGVVTLLRDKLFLNGNGTMHICDWPQPNILVPLTHVVTIPMFVHILEFLMKDPYMVIMRELILHSVGLTIVKDNVECLTILDSIVQGPTDKSCYDVLLCIQVLRGIDSTYKLHIGPNHSLYLLSQNISKLLNLSDGLGFGSLVLSGTLCRLDL